MRDATGDVRVDCCAGRQAGDDPEIVVVAAGWFTYRWRRPSRSSCAVPHNDLEITDKSAPDIVRLAMLDFW
jgi:hypothetical protein